MCAKTKSIETNPLWCHKWYISLIPLQPFVGSAHPLTLWLPVCSKKLKASILAGSDKGLNSFLGRSVKTMYVCNNKQFKAAPLGSRSNTDTEAFSYFSIVLNAQVFFRRGYQDVDCIGWDENSTMKKCQKVFTSLLKITQKKPKMWLITVFDFTFDFTWSSLTVCFCKIHNSNTSGKRIITWIRTTRKIQELWKTCILLHTFNHSHFFFCWTCLSEYISVCIHV